MKRADSRRAECHIKRAKSSDEQNVPTYISSRLSPYKTSSSSSIAIYIIAGGISLRKRKITRFHLTFHRYAHALVSRNLVSWIIFFVGNSGRRADQDGKYFRQTRSRPRSSRKLHRQVVPEKRHLILVRSRLQLEFKLGCAERVTRVLARERERALCHCLSLRNFVTTGVFSTFPKIPLAPGRIH